MKEVPVQPTARCILTAVTQVDIPMLREILDDADTKRFLPELCEEFQTKESLQQFIISFDNYLAHDEGILWGIRLHLNPTLIGFIAIMDMPDNPTLFYAMHPLSRSCGYMKESLAAVIQNKQASGTCQTLQTEVYNNNVISTKLLIGLGCRIHKRDKRKIYYNLYGNK